MFIDIHFLIGNGTYNGLVGDLQSEEADFGCQLFILYDRLSIIAFSQPFDFDYDCFLISKPLPLPQYVALIKPFHVNTWLAFLLTLIILIVLMLAYGKWHPRPEVKGSRVILYMVSIALDESHDLTLHVKSKWYEDLCCLCYSFHYGPNNGIFRSTDIFFDSTN